MPKTVRKSSPNKSSTKKQASVGRLKKAYIGLKKAASGYLARRPHRSFRLTRRRDYNRSLELPGYWSFTLYVLRLMREHRWMFAKLTLLYALVGVLTVGLSSQDAYAALTDIVGETSDELATDTWGSLYNAGLVLAAGMASLFKPQLNEMQQMYAGISFILTWLTSVWLLRAILAGRKPRLRDGLYGAGSPIVSTALILFFIVIQVLPAALGILLFNTALASNVFDSGFLAMIVTLFTVSLSLLSLYWVTSSVIALIIVTLPGMYPWRAVQSAGDIVTGRRVRILLRILWLGFLNSIIWSAITIVTIMLDQFIKKLLPAVEWFPIVPIQIAVVSSFIIVLSAAYIYLLYRKIVEDDSSPA